MGAFFIDLLPSDQHGWLLLALAFIPVMGWLALFFWYDRARPEPKRILTLAFVLGAALTFSLLYIDTVWLHWSDRVPAFLGEFAPSWLLAVVLYLGVALMEEYLKSVALIFVVEMNKAHFDQVVDGIVYGVAAAMGFAFIENILYLGLSPKTMLFGVFLARSLGATLGHAIFSGTFGYFYGRALFATDIIPHHGNVLRTFHRSLPAGLGLHILRTHVFPRRGIFEKAHTRGELIAEGFWAAVGIHLLYDLILVSSTFLAHDYSWLISILLLGGLLFLAQQFYDKANLRTRKLATNILTFPEWLIPTVRARKIRRALKLTPGL